MPALADTLLLRDTNFNVLQRTTVDNLREGLGLDNAYVSHAIVGTTVTFTEADGDTSTLTLPAGGGGGTTVTANPVEVTPSLTEINTIGIGSTNYRIAHPHRGDYDDTRDYLRGDIVETGTDDNSIFWIARAPVSAGNGEPSNADLGQWWRAAGHGFWRGELADATRYQVFQGDTFIANNETWIAVTNVLGPIPAWSWERPMRSRESSGW